MYRYCSTHFFYCSVKSLQETLGYCASLDNTTNSISDTVLILPFHTFSHFLPFLTPNLTSCWCYSYLSGSPQRVVNVTQLFCKQQKKDLLNKPPLIDAPKGRGVCSRYCTMLSWAKKQQTLLSIF